MRSFFRSRVFLSAVAVLLLGASFLYYFLVFNEEPVATEVVTQDRQLPERDVIGLSVEGREIEAYTYVPLKGKDTRNIHLVFVGGIHGGYEWNSVLLAYTFIDYLNANLTIIPENVMVTVIPDANPDGVYNVIGKEGRFALEDVPSDTSTEPGRFNAHTVDLNRNFDCKWKPDGTWRGKEVSAGTGPFSEPESQSIRNFVMEHKPTAFVFWHSQANAVYASECREGILPETLSLMKVYADASLYPPVDSFDAYEVTGDAEGWLASVGIPAITVELKTHGSIDWDRNIAGIKALFEYYRR